MKYTVQAFLKNPGKPITFKGRPYLTDALYFTFIFEGEMDEVFDIINQKEIKQLHIEEVDDLIEL